MALRGQKVPNPEIGSPKLVTLSTSNKVTTAKILAVHQDLEQVEVQGIGDIKAIYEAGFGVIGVCASAILIRAVANSLKNKKTDPLVVAVADDGSAVVPLIGGHYGANSWARDIAKTVEGFAAITTASDVSLGFSFEQPPASLVLVSDGQKHKTTVAQLLKGATVNVRIDCDLPKDAKAYVHNIPNQATPNQDLSGSLFVYVGHNPPSDADLVYVPKTTMVGVGASRNCPPEELRALVESCLAQTGLHHKSIAGVYSHQLKHDEVAVLALAKAFNVEAKFCDSATLNQYKDQLSRVSAVVYRETGCWGVAEAAALHAASQKTLRLHKQKTAMATCAIAIRSNGK